MNRGCMNNYYAFGYPIWTDPKYYAIVLCKGYTGSVLDASPDGLGTLQDTQPRYRGVHVDALTTRMTTKVLHEFIHMADPINQWKCLPSTGAPLSMS